MVIQTATVLVTVLAWHYGTQRNKQSHGLVTGHMAIWGQILTRGESVIYCSFTDVLSIWLFVYHAMGCCCFENKTVAANLRMNRPR